MNNMMLDRKKVLSFVSILGLFPFLIWTIMSFSECQAEAFQKEETSVIDDILTSNVIAIKPTQSSATDNSQLQSSFREAEKSFLLTPKTNVPEVIGCYPQFFDFQDHVFQKYPYLARNITCNGEDFFKLENNLLTITCDNKYRYFAAGSLPSHEVYGRDSLKLNWIAYNNPIDIGEIEFGYVKCGSSYQTFLHNKFSKSASKRAQERRSFMSGLLSDAPPPKPLNVIILMFDSVSRQHFYRVLPNTVEFMNSSIADGELSKKFLIYDFLINNSQDSVTPGNMSPLFFGEIKADYLKRMANFSFNQEEDKPVFIRSQDDALWKFFEQNGFVTMFGYETNNNYNADLWGKTITTDHVATSFWHGAEQLFHFSEMSTVTDCLGNHHSHEFMLNYTREFVENYKGHNKFAYMHLMTGHEQTGSKIKTVDNYLKDTIERMLNFATANDEDIAIFVTADHGQLNKFGRKIEQEFTEIHLPCTFLIANRDLLAKLGPNTHDILTHNSKRLVGKLDWHLTIKQLAIAPYKILDIKSIIYKSWRDKMNTDHPISLFAEMVKDERTCEDIRVPSFRCTCRRFSDLDYVNYAENERLVNYTAQSAVNFINGKINKVNAQEFCINISLDKVLKATYAIIGDPNTSFGRYYKVDFSINENPNYIYRAMAHFDESGDIKKTRSIYCHNKNNTITTYKTNKDNESKVVIDFARRVDNLYGLCDKIGEASGALFQHCLCKDPSTYIIGKNLSEIQIKTYENIKNLLHISIGFKNESCLETCTKLGRFCDEWGMRIINRFDLLEEPWRDDNSYQINFNQTFDSFKNLNSDIREDIKSNAEAKRSKRLFCKDRWTETMSICPCSIITLKTVS